MITCRGSLLDVFKGIQRVVRTPASAYAVTNETLVNEQKYREEFVYKGITPPGLELDMK